jgi:hypothetical protein
MRNWAFGTILFLFLLLVPIGEAVVHALPWCGCGYCYMQSTGRCTCGYPYYWCLEDLQALQFQTSMNAATSETYSTAATTAQSFSTEKVYLTSGGKCLQNKTTLRLLASIRQ